MNGQFVNPASLPAPGIHARPAIFWSLKPVVSLLLFVALFAGLQGGRYFFANRLQEVGTLAALIVFVTGAWITLFQMPHREWRRWVYIPTALIGGIMVTWSATFAIKFDDNFLFSLFASREFLLGFTGPAMFLIVRAGYPLASLERVVWCCLLALLANYLFWYNTMDLRAAFFSPDHTISSLVTYDEWRGFRLKPSMFAVMLSLLGGVTLVAGGKSLPARMFGLVLAGTAVYIWTIVQFRSTLATMLLSIALYWIILIRPRRFQLLILAAPLIIVAMPIIAGLLLTHFAEADGGQLRLDAYRVALGNILLDPLLGVGEDNAYGKTYYQLFRLFPSDLGIVGVFFKYGLIGTTAYLYFHFLIWGRLWKANYQRHRATGRHHPLLWGLLIVMTAQTLNLVLIPGLAYAQGITIGSLSIAFCALIPPQDQPGLA